MSTATLRLKRQEERRLRAGHAWVFSNEVDVSATPLTALEPGQPVIIETAAGQPIGSGYANPRSLICARLVSRDPHQLLDGSLLVHRLKVALSLRETLFPAPFYRLVYGESDGLPGVVVDRFDDTVVVQITTAGMERLTEALLDALDKVLKPRVIVLRNDGPLRALEGLESVVQVARGQAGETLAVEENGARFEVPLLGGQKTGWFYDHRMNRARLAHYARGKRVLDVFSYVGGWGVQAALAGADEVLCVDSAAKALEQAAHNAALNGVAERVGTLNGDAFEVLKALRAERAKFDVVVLDPPAFIKRKKDLKEGVLAYRRLNQMALQVLAKDGILVSASCSYHLPRDTLSQVMLQAARHVDRTLQVVEQGHQGPDHPVHPAIPETDYLKAFIARVLPG